MNDTQQALPPPPPTGPSDQSGPSGRSDEDFDARRLRTIADMERSSDDRIVAGVCAGAARYLNVDPIIIRVILAVLTVAGFAGVILYVAAWILLPADDADKSLVAEWFKLDRNEEQVRVAGLVGAVILATLSLVGDSSWAWWGDTAWWLVPLGGLFYLFWVRPRRRREARATNAPAADGPEASSDTVVMARPGAQQKPKKTRTPRSPALVLLTASLSAIALAAVWIYDETQRDVHWTTYVAAALAVVALGLLIGTFVGDAGPLIGIGLLLAIALAIGSAFPSGRIGSQVRTPTVAAAVQPHYQHGIGELEVDLTQVSDPERLQGRTISIDTGIGQTTVIVPAGLAVVVDTHVQAGEVRLFDRSDDGTDVSLSSISPTSADGTALTIDIDQKLGQIEVISR